MDATFVFAGLAILVSVIRYGLYLWSIYQRETEPHFFSWFNWAVVVGIGAYAQFSIDDGLSAWVLLIVSSTCFLIANHGWKKACANDPGLANGLNVSFGTVNHAEVAEALDLPYKEVTL